jgi:hypothetical protein
MWKFPKKTQFCLKCGFRISLEQKSEIAAVWRKCNLPLMLLSMTTIFSKIGAFWCKRNLPLMLLSMTTIFSKVCAFWCKCNLPLMSCYCQQRRYSRNSVHFGASATSLSLSITWIFSKIGLKKKRKGGIKGKSMRRGKSRIRGKFSSLWYINETLNGKRGNVFLLTDKKREGGGREWNSVHNGHSFSPLDGKKGTMFSSPKKKSFSDLLTDSHGSYLAVFSRRL